MGAEVAAFLSHATRAASMAKTTFKLLEKSLPYKAPPVMTVSQQSGGKPILVAADDLPETQGEDAAQLYIRFVHDDADASLRSAFPQVQ